MHVLSHCLSIFFWTIFAIGAKEEDSQRPIKSVDHAKFQSACPDYAQYSKYALQSVSLGFLSPLIILLICLTFSGPFGEGPMALPFQRPIPDCRTFSSPLVEKIIDDLTNRMIDKDLARLFENAFPNTLDTTVRWQVDGKAKKNSAKGKWEGLQSFIVTGDINAEWLRDSTNQLAQYQRLAKKDSAIHDLILGAINTQAEYVITSPYCNAFQPPPPSRLASSPNGQDDSVHPAYELSFVFECKYELDSLAAFLSLTTQFYLSTGSKEPLTKRWFNALDSILKVLDEQSKGTFDLGTGAFMRNEYTFERATRVGTETLNLGGIGNPINSATGLVRSAFRPSDDATILPFFIPGNAMMSVELKRAGDMLEKEGYSKIGSKLKARGEAIERGIYNHGVVNHRTFGEIFAFEVDGYGSSILMDDANLPSLLALPIIGFVDAEDPIYSNTRKMILSKNGNPYYLTGRSFRGIGGPHIGPSHAWPMSLLVECMTSDNDKEIMDNMALVKKASALGLIHESVNVNSVRDYTSKLQILVFFVL